MTLNDFRQTFVVIVKLWTWIGMVLYLIPIIFWIVAGIDDKTVFTVDADSDKGA